jgi:hypothetical protein
MSMRGSSIDWVQASGSRNETLTAMTGASLPRTNVWLVLLRGGGQHPGHQDRLRRDGANADRRRRWCEGALLPPLMGEPALGHIRG